jgi:hypothetical protein
MFCRVGRATLFTAIFAAAALPAQAQYYYPGGYGGWGGWGGGGATVQGSIARGMGAYAAGAGAYNVQTAQARSINANTAMMVNEYMYESQQVSNRREYYRMAERQQSINKSADATYQRLHDNPNIQDIHRGDALNVVLDELTNPRDFSQVTRMAKQPVDSQLVKAIPFQYAAKMITISLEDFSERGVPDVLADNPKFESDRKTLKALFAKAKDEAHSESQISMDTIRACRAAVKALHAKVEKEIPKGTRDRDEADNFLKALYGLTKMLETPAVDKFLMGLNNYPTTTLSMLLTFMQSFNLRFGVAKTPAQEQAYDKLYPMLTKLRDQAQVKSQNPVASGSAPQDPTKVSKFFSGMDYKHFQPQPDPHAGTPAPPAPNSPQ